MLTDDISKAVCETEGVLSLAGEGPKGIRINKSDSGLQIEVNVLLSFGIRIPDMAWKLQQRVKEVIGDAEIDSININIRGIRENG
jgi:uncharacterized alkaline shock family protein YloU